MNLYTSDTHFHHKGVIKFARRYDYVQTVDEMNELIVKLWNLKVSPDDTIWHLGDVSFGDLSILDELNGYKRLILGNHDWKKRNLLERYFDVYERDIYTDNKEHLVLSHYPILDWPGRYHGWIHLHGHSHGKRVYDNSAVDVGVDSWKLEPINLAEIREEIAVRKKKEIEDDLFARQQEL